MAGSTCIVAGLYQPTAAVEASCSDGDSFLHAQPRHLQPKMDFDSSPAVSGDVPRLAVLHFCYMLARDTQLSLDSASSLLDAGDISYGHCKPECRVQGFGRARVWDEGLKGSGVRVQAFFGVWPQT